MSSYLLGALKCIGWGFLILTALNLAGVLWLLAINPDPPDEPDDVTATYLAYLEGGWDQ